MNFKEIIIISDYKNVFGSKHFAKPYRSGFNKDKIKDFFEKEGFSSTFLRFSDINFNSSFKDKIVIYTSSEDIGYYYKNFIEDIVLGLENIGAITIPHYKYLRANNNKVFMEILRQQSSLESIKNIKSRIYGVLEEALNDQYLKNSKYPKVLKLAEGASGKNVYLAYDYNDLIKKIKKICRTRNIYYDLWDFLRSVKHKGYIRESLYRKKFIVQEFIPNLKNDWKIYVFYDSYFIFYRPVFKKRVFKASGGGYDNYFYGLNANIPEGIFDFAESIRKEFNTPQLSLDIAYDGKEFYLLEFQFIYFGTAGIPYSEEYFVKQNGKWVAKQNPKDQEYFYVDSIIKFINHELSH